MCMFLQGRYRDAETQYEELRAMRVEIMGPKAPDVAKVHRNLGYLLVKTVRHIRFTSLTNFHQR